MRYNHEKFIGKLFALSSEEEQMATLKDYMLSLPFEEFNRFIKWQSSDFRTFCQGLKTREDISKEEKDAFVKEMEKLFEKSFALSSNQKAA